MSSPDNLNDVDAHRANDEHPQKALVEYGRISWSLQEINADLRSDLSERMKIKQTTAPLR